MSVNFYHFQADNCCVRMESTMSDRGWDSIKLKTKKVIITHQKTHKVMQSINDENYNLVFMLLCGLFRRHSAFRRRRTEGWWWELWEENPQISLLSAAVGSYRNTQSITKTFGFIFASARYAAFDWRRAHSSSEIYELSYADACWLFCCFLGAFFRLKNLRFLARLRSCVWFDFTLYFALLCLSYHIHSRMLCFAP